MDGPEGKELNLVGVFDTNSAGRNPGNPNCFLFPLTNGGWRVYRFSPGIAEAETWSQDGQGWTTCYFNRRPDLDIAAKIHGGIEDPEKAGITFSRRPTTPCRSPRPWAKTTLRSTRCSPTARPRSRPIKTAAWSWRSNARKGTPSYTEPEGWLAKKTKWVRVFETTISDKKDDDLGLTEYDNLIRAIETPAKQFVGWVVYKGGEWIGQPGRQRQNAAAKPGQCQGRRRVRHGRGSRQGVAAGQPPFP